MCLKKGKKNRMRSNAKHPVEIGVPNAKHPVEIGVNRHSEVNDGNK
ncbi:hypothetical protein LTSEADE_1107 [Salmonella enterica subsp. enterica serovar Adelaide str. A4-669]|uniref:Uncharacterized protein n=1 Tax=Salmonella enterica subsp. enterica serovar Adelaide str. A4-669 TaxID=913063 RepID=A0A6C8GR88_SALET|nr:hypothetical protein LTSEADE_1107 [Salmonella enterica subsp. enterica serovar Adelaide str. A4-669]